MDAKIRIKKLVEILNEASKAYYQEDREIMSNFEYDKLYDELVDLEQTSGIVMANSPTRRVGYESLEELPKERHESPMLSLNKTKDSEELRAWLGDGKGILSWKLDGLTIVLTYRNGMLQKAVTRGNGEIGEVITNNAGVFKNIPWKIPFQGELILRGEAVIKYADFEEINKNLDADARYKNPRNLCSGTVRQLNNKITAQRNVHFIAFALVQAPGVDFHNSRRAQFIWLQEQGFDVVGYEMVDKDNILQMVEKFAQKIQTYDVPSDGLVLLLDDIAYGEALGRTAKFPRNAIAFKWQDETAKTHLLQIEWSPSRTGLINPVAVFEPVELEGTTVSRASVHNVSIVRELKLGEGDELEVYKANMIIPQIAENITKSDRCQIPKKCPACGEETVLKENNAIQYLYCVNAECPAKKIKSFQLLVSRDALNIEGMSEATLEKLLDHGMIREFADIFHLDRHKDVLVNMEGFGEKSYQNLIEKVENARHTDMYRFLYGIGISNVGLVNAKVLCRYFQNDFERLCSADAETLAGIDGIGPVIGESIVSYLQNPDKKKQAQHLLNELDIKQEKQEEQLLKDKTFVITGSTQLFKNRSEMKEFIEGYGGKVTGSVSSKTDYLVNNDITSASGKNKKAKELGIPIISEEELKNMMQL